MTKTLGIVYAIILFISLFLVLQNTEFEDYYYIECQRDFDCPQLNSEIFAFKCIEKLCKLEFIYQQAPFLLGQV
ncbi:Nodule Cysteine-Rich (NCR) secreted peptide [Medicago truncatula]|uniref:Nodule Cysteine-Rich (NCR) secreted peptide n=1 Tax=Medicago truncatula TaxID=3880 RepID=G7K5D9_MEDTR|nr:Nodule Cysteine-Rich (NCR) secreted peptide [Medicago truncatula]